MKIFLNIQLKESVVNYSLILLTPQNQSSHGDWRTQEINICWQTLYCTRQLVKKKMKKFVS